MQPMATVAVLYNDDGDLPFGEAHDAIAVEDSRRGAEAVCAALTATGYDACIIPAGNEPVALAAALTRMQPDLVFNVCESFAGNPQLEYAVAALLELLHLSYTGSPPRALALAQDKSLAKNILSDTGLAVPRGCVLKHPDDHVSQDLILPLIVKLCFCDASHGISEKNLCASVAEVRAQAAYLTKTYGQPVVVEEFINGREFNVSVLGAGEVLPLAEIAYDLPCGLPHIITYAAKWLETSPYYVGTPVICPAQNVLPVLEEKIRTAARKAYQVMGCRDYGRIDIRLNMDGEPCVIEVNPNPCIMSDAGLARAACAAGMSYNDLIDRIARSALQRRPA
jgi:D-alanine-D-alanine ligase